MNILKAIVRKLFSLPITEGDYVATVSDVSIKRLRGNRLSLIKIKFKLTNVDTGDKFTHVEAIVDDFELICRSNIAWLFEIYRIFCVDYYDLIGAVFDISVEYDVVCGRKKVVLWYNDLITPPCTFDECEVN